MKNEIDLTSETFLGFTKEETIYNLILQTTVVADTAEPKWPEINKCYRNRSIYDHTRIQKVGHKKFTNHCSFSTKS